MILVVGATGTVGRKVIDKLLENPQNKVRAIARGKSDWEGSVLPSFRRRGVEVMVGDIRSEQVITRAVEGAKCIINCAGLMRATPEEDLAEVNIDGTQNLIEQGKKAGIQRFIQLSCLGATEHATNQYFACRWEADELVRKSGLYWTIFRPSLIFDQGSNNNTYRILEFWIARSPIIVMVGSGLNRFQPISADDVATCVAHSVYDRDTVNKIYELPGPETIDLNTLLTLVAENQGRQVRTIKIPSFIGVPIFGLLSRLNPKCPIDHNVMSVMTSDMIGDDSQMLAKFVQLERMQFKLGIEARTKRPETELADSRPGSAARKKQISDFASRADEPEDEEDSDPAEATPPQPVEEAPPPDKPAKAKKPMNFKRKI